MINPSSLVAVALLLSLASSSQLSLEDTYDRNESKEFAYYAGLAYCPKKCLEAWNCQDAKALSKFG